jgi:hypothetical protein
MAGRGVAAPCVTGRFQQTASQAQKDVIDDVLQPLINDNFTHQPSAGPAFAALTGAVFAQIKINDAHVSQLESLSLPTTIIWGGIQHDLVFAGVLELEHADALEVHDDGAVAAQKRAGKWVVVRSAGARFKRTE